MSTNPLFKDLRITLTPPIITRQGKGGKLGITGTQDVPYSQDIIDQHNEGKVFIVGAIPAPGILINGVLKTFVPFDTDRNKAMILGISVKCPRCDTEVRKPKTCRHCQVKECNRCGLVLP